MASLVEGAANTAAAASGGGDAAGGESRDGGGKGVQAGDAARQLFRGDTGIMRRRRKRK